MRKTLVTMLAVLIGLMPLQAASKSVGNTNRKVAKLSSQESKSNRTVIFEDGFETYADFATDFAPWVMIDGDGEETYVINGVTFPNQGYTGSFIIWTPAGATPAQTASAWLPHGGTKSATCFDAIVPTKAPNNDWLISPPITLQTASQLKFWAESVTDDYGLEKFKVGVSTGGTAATDFTIISGATAVSAPVDWTEFSYDLAAYDGQSVRIAIQCVSNDAFALQIDDFSVTAGASTDTQAPTVATPTGTSAAPGTAMNISTVVTDATGIASVVGKYKLVGQNTWSEFAMTASKATGTYTGTIPSQPATIAGKVKFATTDTASPANTGESAEFDIAWTAASPDEMWVTWGEDFGTSGVGTPSPWQAATDYDFGPNSQYELKKIVMKGFNNTNSAAQDFSWTVRNATQADANTLELGTALTGLQGTVNSVPGEEVIQDVTVNTKLIGHIALILDMPAAYNIITSNNVPSTNDNHTYVGVAADSLQLLKSLASTLNHRAWYLKMFVKKPVGIEEVQMLPGRSELQQNYPNPFNPTTTISFYNNMTGNVKLSVMNAKGETVATLVNNSVVAGNHKVDFDGSTFNSGVYFYKLETPTATVTKKMLLVK